jgi:hypothetical protein
MEANAVINSELPIFVQGSFIGGNLNCDLYFSSDTPIFNYCQTGSDGQLPRPTLKWILTNVSGSSTKTLTVQLIAFNQFEIQGQKEGAVKVTVSGDLLARPTWG